MLHELPDHLRPTANLLSASLCLRSNEKAPAIPADLLADLTARFSATPMVQAAPQKHSWFQAARSFVSRPAFGICSAAAVVAIIAVPSLIKEDDSTVFRGDVTIQTDIDAASIILVGAPEGTREMLQSNGYFDSTALTGQTASSASAKVVVDYNSSLILAIDSQGKTIFSTEIPANDDELADAIATALSNF